MKMIIAIIQQERLHEVLDCLYANDINLITVSQVLGHGRQKGITEVYRGFKEMGSLLPKVRLDIAVNDSFVEPCLKAIVQGAKSGEVGDGKIFVLDLEQCLRIRTEEKGSKAIG